MQIKKIQKHPFVRPLFVWIAGINLHIFCPARIISFSLLLISFVALLVSGLLPNKREPGNAYRQRWVWGGVFTSLLLVLSIQTTAFHERKPAQNISGKYRTATRSLRQQLLSPLENTSLSNAEKSVLSTLTLGYKESVPKEIRQRFSATGVAHILAISGFHVATVCGFISLLLSFLTIHNAGQWIKYTVTLLFLWGFTLLTGLAASSVRAAIMLSLYLTGKQFRRNTDSYNTLAASAFCMLVYDPFYLFDIGFQLSYIAVFFILFLEPEINSWIKIRNPLVKKFWNLITVTLAAQTGVLFLCLYYFGEFSSVFLLTNLPVTLIATFLIPIALLWMILPAQTPGLQWLQYGMEALTHLMMWIIDAFSRIPGSSFAFHFRFSDMLIGYILLFILLFYYKSQIKSN